MPTDSDSLATPTPPPTALVTGASGGLGRGIATELAAAGLSVAIHFGGNEAGARETAELCRAAAPHGAAQLFPLVQGDVGEDASRRELYDQALVELGGHLDVFVSNAGITSPGRKDVTEAEEEGFDRVMAVNLKGPHFLAQAAARYWLAHPGQSRLSTGYKLIFVSSVSAHMASLNRGDYCISKAGLAMAAHVWALRLAGQGVQVVELRPGIMLTGMTEGVKGKYDERIEQGLVPAGRWGYPEDVGRPVRSIVEGQWAFATGSVITLDGGLSLPVL